MTSGEIRQEEYKFRNQIYKILKRNNILMPYIKWHIEQSSEYEDCNLSYDMKYNGVVELSVRIRKNEYLKYRDFTIRSKSKNGYECEIDKLMKGMGNIYFYGWMNKAETGFDDWIVVNINAIREKLLDGTFRSNTDNTGFLFYPIEWLRKNNAIISEHQTQLALK